MIEDTAPPGYRIVNRIKLGGVSIVYKGETLVGKNTVAIKIIHDKVLNDRDVVSGFKKEAKILNQLDHKGIISVIDFYPGPPKLATIMEYFESENLRYYLKCDLEFVKRYQMKIIRDVGEAILYLHLNNVIHKDIKPENILVNKRGEVRLIDFSLAQKKRKISLGLHTKIQGTPTYISPEEIKKKSIDERSDIYSFGVTMFEILTGKPPFTGTTQDEVLEKHLIMPIPSVRSFNKKIHYRIDRIVTEALAKRPEDRVKDMFTVLYEFQKLGY